jgi:hypothetical protein
MRPPQVVSTEVQLTSRCKRVFANAHTYHIHSISLSSDRETFISADDLRINLWNLEVTNQSFNIVDIKPANMEDLTEVRDAVNGVEWRRSWVRLPCSAHRRRTCLVLQAWSGSAVCQPWRFRQCGIARAVCRPWSPPQTLW